MICASCIYLAPHGINGKSKLIWCAKAGEHIEPPEECNKYKERKA